MTRRAYGGTGCGAALPAAVQGYDVCAGLAVIAVIRTLLSRILTKEVESTQRLQNPELVVAET